MYMYSTVATVSFEQQWFNVFCPSRLDSDAHLSLETDDVTSSSVSLNIEKVFKGKNEKK